MAVMLVYILIAMFGEVLAFFAGAAIDPIVSDGWSMIIYMGLFFGVLYIAWPVAVRVTEKYLPQYAR